MAGAPLGAALDMPNSEHALGRSPSPCMLPGDLVTPPLHLLRSSGYETWSSNLVQEGKKHTDTSNRRFPRTYGKIWEVGRKTKTQKIWANIGNMAASLVPSPQKLRPAASRF
eukprot:8711810-Pyramimonas_sp.AAC.1